LAISCQKGQTGGVFGYAPTADGLENFFGQTALLQ